MIEIIPPLETPHFEMRAVLDEIEYNIKINWNHMTEIYEMSLFLNDDTPIFQGLKCCINFPVFIKYRNSNAPKGIILFYDSSLKNLEAGIDDLGQRVKIYYIPQSEI